MSAGSATTCTLPDLPTLPSMPSRPGAEAPSPRHVAVAYCQGTPLRNEIEARDASRLEEATNRATEALAQRFGKDAIAGRIRAVVVTALR